MGGLEVYQRMSTIGQGDDRGGGSHKVLISWLKEMGMCEMVRGGKGKLRCVLVYCISYLLTSDPHIISRLLEVGALKPDNHQSCAEWIECMPIDLRSRHPGILEQEASPCNVLLRGTKWAIELCDVRRRPEPHFQDVQRRCSSRSRRRHLFDNGLPSQDCQLQRGGDFFFSIIVVLRSDGLCRASNMSVQESLSRCRL
jgi:hypothetical protein